jgi:hypothetical protein
MTVDRLRRKIYFRGGGLLDRFRVSNTGNESKGKGQVPGLVLPAQSISQCDWHRVLYVGLSIE